MYSSYCVVQSTRLSIKWTMAPPPAVFRKGWLRTLIINFFKQSICLFRLSQALAVAHAVFVASRRSFAALIYSVAVVWTQEWAGSVLVVHRLSCSLACGILVTGSGIEPSSPALQILNHWTTWESPENSYYCVRSINPKPARCPFSANQHFSLSRVISCHSTPFNWVLQTLAGHSCAGDCGITCFTPFIVSFQPHHTALRSWAVLSEPSLFSSVVVWLSSHVWLLQPHGLCVARQAPLSTGFLG